MRLFTGIDLPADVTAAIDRLIAELRPSAPIAWSKASNLHITTKFIGSWPEERLPELRAVLGSLPPRAPIPIAVRGLGYYPNARAPRVFWAGVEAGPELAALAREIDERTAALGIEPEKRQYSPHLTLARIREAADLSALRKAVETRGGAPFGAFTADRFYLYLSKPGPGGSVYTKLSEFPFQSS
jgi:2'-5' RNA ligase